MKSATEKHDFDDTTGRWIDNMLKYRKIKNRRSYRNKDIPMAKSYYIYYFVILGYYSKRAESKCCWKADKLGTSQPNWK